MNLTSARAAFSCSHHDAVRQEVHGHSYVAWAYWPAEPPRDQVLLQRMLEETVKARYDHKTMGPEIGRMEDIANDLGGLLVDVHSIMVERPVEGFRVVWSADPPKQKVNIYEREFVAACPNNGEPITYQLMICKPMGERIFVEEIVAATDMIEVGYHEDIADSLLNDFGGKQILSAHHHGVTIETIRGG